MDAFVRAAVRQSFSAAARDMGVTPSAVSKQVSRLEKRLGVRLINRTTRRLHLTPEGETFFARCERILADIEDAEVEIALSASQPKGILRMHSNVAFAHHQFSAAMRDFSTRYPEIHVELSVSDTLMDLIDTGADLAVRTGPLPDSTLIAKRIGNLERVICASPAYLRHFGTPKTPRELLEHNCLVPLGSRALRRWQFLDLDKTNEHGVSPTYDLEIQGRHSSNNADMLLQWGLSGVGIVRLTDLMMGPAIRAGDMIPLLTDCHVAEQVPMWAVCPNGRQAAPRVQAMIGFLDERFSESPWRLPRDE